MEQTNSAGRGGKRAKPGMPVGAKIAIAAALVAAAAFSAYAGLCAWVGDKIPTGTQVELTPSGQVLSLGGMTADEARTLLSESIQPDLSRTLTVKCAGLSADIGANCFEPDPEAMLETLDQAMDLTASRPFLTRGAYYLAEQMGGGEETSLELPCVYGYAGSDAEQSLHQLLSNMASATAQAAADPTYEVGEETIEVVTGTTGAALDVDAAKDAILDAFNAGAEELELTLDPVEPSPLNAETLNQLVYVEPKPVGVDADGNTTPPVVGVSIDVPGTQAALDAAQPGSTLSIPIVRTQPDYAEAGENGLLYQDKLSECVTNIGGSSGRLANVTLAAEKVNGAVLLPGDTFDYNKAVGQRTAAAGFHSAPAYYMGQTVNEIGGGICQVSSSIYYCTVYANLQVVNRSNHRYAVGYVPDGLDATVSWGGPEYRFRNNTDFPIKIVAFVQGRTLTVQFYGTNLDGTYVTTERSQLSSTPSTTVYKPDPSIPQGTTKTDVTPYTGRKVVVYRVVHAADGTVISRTQENTSNYSARDKVILYNPADAASLGLSAEQPAPVESTPVIEPPAPVESTEPAPAEPPVVNEPPAPAEEEPPVLTPPPAELEPEFTLPEGDIPLD